MQNNDSAVPGGNATLHSSTEKSVDVILLEQEVQRLLNTITAKAEYIQADHPDDIDGDNAFEIQQAVERLEDLLLCATGLREVAQ